MIRFTKLGLEFYLKAIIRRWSFVSESKHSILIVLWWELFWFHLLFSLEIYQLFFWLSRNLIIWRNPGLEFPFKFIFRIWMFICESKHLIFSVLWWKHVWPLLFCLKIYQLFLLFLKTLIRWITLGLGFSLKVIFRRWMLRGDSKHSILNVSWWGHFLYHLLFYLELYQLLFLFFETLIIWRKLGL